MGAGGGEERGAKEPKPLLLFSIAYWVYVALAVATLSASGKQPRLAPLLLAAAGWACLALGYLRGPRIPRVLYAASLSALAISVLRTSALGVGAAVATTALFIALRDRVDSWLRYSNPRSPKAYVPALAIGAALFLAGWALCGLPLLDPSARSGYVPRLFGSAALALTAASALSGRAWVAAASATLGLLTGFRSYALLPVLAWASAQEDEKQVLSFLGVLAVGAVFLGALRGLEGTPDPLGILHRVAFTYWVYEEISLASLPTGLYGGQLLLSLDPRRRVASLFGRGTTRYTYFFMGQPVGDFGVFGLVEALLLGFLFGSAGLGATGAMALAFLTVSVETGVDSLLLGVLLACSYASSVRAESQEPEQKRD